MKIILTIEVFLQHFNRILIYAEKEDKALLEDAFLSSKALEKTLWMPKGYSLISLPYHELLEFVTPNCTDLQLFNNVITYYNDLRKLHPHADFSKRLMYNAINKLELDYADFSSVTIGNINQSVRKGEFTTSLNIDLRVGGKKWVCNYMLTVPPYDYCRFFYKMGRRQKLCQLWQVKKEMKSIINKRQRMRSN